MARIVSNKIGCQPVGARAAASSTDSCAGRNLASSNLGHVTSHLPRVGLVSGFGNRQATAVLEFALAAPASVGLFLFVIALGFRLYVQVALDYATCRAARLLAVDTTQSLSPSAGTFQTITFCPLLTPFLACTHLSIALASVADFRNSSAIGASGPPPFNPGQSGSLMVLRVSYTMPGLSWPQSGQDGVSRGFGGVTVTASYPYQNEY